MYLLALLPGVARLCLLVVGGIFRLGIMYTKHGDEAGEGNLRDGGWSTRKLGVGGIASHSIPPSCIHTLRSPFTLLLTCCVSVFDLLNPSSCHLPVFSTTYKLNEVMFVEHSSSEELDSNVHIRT